SLFKAKPGQLGAIESLAQLATEKIASFEKLEVREIFRLVLRFRDRFWERIAQPAHPTKSLSDMSFLFSRDEFFPTWWTTMPKKLPMITGWAPFRSAQRLVGLKRSHIIEQSLRTIESLLAVRFDELESQLQAAHLHDWQN